MRASSSPLPPAPARTADAALPLHRRQCHGQQMSSVGTLLLLHSGRQSGTYSPGTVMVGWCCAHVRPVTVGTPVGGLPKAAAAGSAAPAPAAPSPGSTAAGRPLVLQPHHEVILVQPQHQLAGSVWPQDLRNTRHSCTATHQHTALVSSAMSARQHSDMFICGAGLHLPTACRCAPHAPQSAQAHQPQSPGLLTWGSPAEPAPAQPSPPADCAKGQHDALVALSRVLIQCGVPQGYQSSTQLNSSNEEVVRASCQCG
jgi:hypothetical protein